ncbi:MAG: Hpt domain-containing protein [Planctomycetes bacterium]|nr:Hpt domain-containing protein [Planctomycetota bacterium]
MSGHDACGPGGADPDGIRGGIVARLEVLGLFSEPEMARGMLELFRSSCSELLESIAQAVGSGAAEPCRTAAHTLKGTARNLGADHLGDLAFALEQCGGTADFAAAAAQLDEARAEHQRVEAVLAQLDAELGQSS